MTSASIGTFSRLASVLALGLAVGACTTSRLEDIAPLSGVRNTGVTPDLNVPQQAETEQFSNDDMKATISELKSARSGQGEGGAGRPTAATAAQLRKAAKGQAETLREIEGE
jgi:hypothetical protein